AAAILGLPDGEADTVLVGGLLLNHLQIGDVAQAFADRRARLQLQLGKVLDHGVVQRVLQTGEVELNLLQRARRFGELGEDDVEIAATEAGQEVRDRLVRRRRRLQQG